MATNEEIFMAIGELKGTVNGMGRSLERVEKKIDDYQTSCEEDRHSLDKRIGSVEGFQTRQVKAASFAGGVIGLFTSLGVEWFRKG